MDWVATEKQLADVFTKALGDIKFAQFKSRLVASDMEDVRRCKSELEHA